MGTGDPFLVGKETMIRERASVWRYTYIARLVTTDITTLTSSEFIY
jgi:hypothetical protein